MAGLSLSLTLNVLVFGGSALVVRYGLKLRDGTAPLLATVLLGWLYIVLGLELLGCWGQIRIGPAVAISAVGFAGGLFCWWLNRRRPSESSQVPGTYPQSASNTSVERWSIWLAVTLTLWAVADVLIGGLLGPVQVASDAPIYHLPFAIRWWKTGTLELLPTPFGESAAPYFPANVDVWFAWLVLIWSAETLAKVGQWPFLLVGMAAVYALGRELGAGRLACILPAMLWGTGSLQLAHAGWADVDLGLAAWYLVSTWFLVRYARSGRLVDLGCSGLAAGAALGSKYVALLFVPWLVIAAGVLIWKNRRQWHHVAVLIGCLLVASGYWYGRNLLLTGNPLYPLHFELFGLPVLRGWYVRETLLSPPYHIDVAEVGVLLQMLLRALDPILLPFWLAGVVAAGWQAVRGRWLASLLVGLACLHIVLFWWVNPYQTQDRFLFAAFGLLAAPVALVVQRSPWFCVALAALVGWHLVVGQLDVGISDFPQPLPALMPLLQSGQIRLGRLALLVGIGTAVWLAWQWRGSVSGRLGLSALMLVIAFGGAAWRADETLRQFRTNSKRAFYPLWPEGGFLEGWLQLEAASDRPARVAYAGTNLPYYLFGQTLSNQVQYVNINRHTDFLMHDYHAAHGVELSDSSTPDWDRRESDGEAWLNNLRKQEIDLLFIGRTNIAGGVHNVYDSELFPVERSWADAHPEVFRLLHADQFTRLYSVCFTSGEGSGFGVQGSDVAVPNPSREP